MHELFFTGRTRRTAVFAIAMFNAALSAACGSHDAQLAPTASAETLAPSKPASLAATKFVVSPDSVVGFMMDAPDEKIRGRVTKAASGELFIDPADLTKTTGNVAVDISTLELYQKKKDDSGNFTEESKSDLQNQHARAWLEIDDTAPADIKKRNSRVEFAIRKIESVSQKNVMAISGDERRVQVKASGDFLLHGRQSQKTVDLEVTFRFAAGKIASVSVKTMSPLPIGLAEHDVHPREAFGKLAQKTLAVLAPKVAKEAQVEFEVMAAPDGAPPPPAPEVAVAASSEVAASASAAMSAAPSGNPVVPASARAVPTPTASH